jgi:integrase
MSRRGNGEGTITRRKDGRWEARYTVVTANGPKRKVLYGKTRVDVSAKLTKAMADRDVGLIFDAAGSTVSDYLDRWLSDAVKGTVRESTYSRDKYLVTNHIKPALGRLKLKNLNALHLPSGTLP